MGCFDAARICVSVAGMKPNKSIFDELANDPAADAAADARADADVRAGRLISHEAMTRWLKTWGSGKRAPKPIAGD